MARLVDLVRRLFDGKGKRGPRPSESLADVSAKRPESLAEGNNDFALALYGALGASPGNMLFSPFSLRTTLAMTRVGARGETASQMAETLRTVATEETSGAELAEIIRRLHAGGDQYEMAVANSLWGQEGAPLRTEFLDVITRDYGGTVNLVDFLGNADGARATINKWVEDETKEKILNLIPPGGLSAATRLVLANAVYFKGRWVLPFDRDMTRDEPFHLGDGGTERVPLMYRQQAVRYLQGAGFQAVDLLYEGRNLSMLIFLPNRNDGLADLERQLSTGMLHDCVARMGHREVKLFLPRFKITWGAADLCGPLAGLGMSLAFDPSRADFSGINGCSPPDQEALFISAVCHKALAEVNEEGTEAAAATATLMAGAMSEVPHMPPRVPVFRADHPFLFAIRERNTGVILFLGRIANPTEDS